MLQDIPPAWVVKWECVMKDEKKPEEECPADLTPVEQPTPNAAPDSGGGGNTNPPKPGGK